MKISGIANLHDKELIDVRFDESIERMNGHLNDISQLTRNPLSDALDATRAMEKIIKPQINIIDAMKTNVPDFGNTYQIPHEWR